MFQIFFQWEKFITPQIVKLFYYLMLAGVIIAGITGIFSSFAMMRYFGFSMGFMYLIGAILGTVIGCIFARIITELIMVTFSINDHLKAIKENGRR